ncbi:hypothetical protein Tco_0675880 [Tanacetum coccineum]
MAATVAAAYCVTFGYKYGTPHGVKYLRGLDTNQRAIFARLHQVNFCKLLRYIILLKEKRNLNFYGVPHDCTEKLMNKIGELRAISGHVLGAAGVQIPQNNLDNLQSIREEEDGATDVSDP